MPVKNHLRELIARKNLTITEVATDLRMNPNSLYDLANLTTRSIKFDLLDKLCHVLECKVGDLFTVYDEDPFAGARQTGELTIHLTGRWQSPDQEVGPSGLSPETYAKFDFEALNVLYRYADDQGIRVHFRTHPRSVTAEAAREVLDEGNSIVLASQLTGNLTERLVSSFYGVPPFDAALHDEFPMVFGWDDRDIDSSFGFRVANGQPPGLYRSNRRDLIAARTHVTSTPGLGNDCGMIVVYRDGDDDEPGEPDRYVVVCAGHGGVATLAGAQLLTRPELANDFYPSSAKVPRMRGFQASFERAVVEKTEGYRDNRHLNAESLLPEITVDVASEKM